MEYSCTIPLFPANLQTAGNERLTQAIEISNPQKNWTTAEMASQTFLSVSQLHHLFRQRYNTSPMDAVIKQRMQMAIRMMIEGDYSIAEIGTAVGYSSVSSFSRLFKKYVGMSPKEFRVTCRKRQNH